jgi:hypothetical protein
LGQVVSRVRETFNLHIQTQSPLYFNFRSVSECDKIQDEEWKLLGPDTPMKQQPNAPDWEVRAREHEDARRYQVLKRLFNSNRHSLLIHQVLSDVGLEVLIGHQYTWRIRHDDARLWGGPCG